MNCAINENDFVVGYFSKILQDVNDSRNLDRQENSQVSKNVDEEKKVFLKKI